MFCACIGLGMLLGILASNKSYKNIEEKQKFLLPEEENKLKETVIRLEDENQRLKKHLEATQSTKRLFIIILSIVAFIICVMIVSLLTNLS